MPAYIFALVIIWNSVEGWTEEKQHTSAETTTLINVTVNGAVCHSEDSIYSRRWVYVCVSVSSRCQEVFQSCKVTAAAQLWPNIWLDTGRQTTLTLCI